MSMTFLICALVIMSASAVALICALKNAVRGSEDELGFHADVQVPDESVALSTAALATARRQVSFVRRDNVTVA